MATNMTESSGSGKNRLFWEEEDFEELKAYNYWHEMDRQALWIYNLLAGRFDGIHQDGNFLEVNANPANITIFGRN
jgi:hypothetical protein